jgi:hypothetical protein
VVLEPVNQRAGNPEKPGADSGKIWPRKLNQI